MRMRLVGMLALAWAGLLLTGCSSYQLQGKVIEGAESAVLIVPADDPRLNEPGLHSAQVALTLDPDRLSAKPVGRGTTELDGTFSVPVDEFGAGFLQHDVEVLVRLQGHAPAWRTIRLPGAGQRLLVTLGPGEDRMPERRGDVLEETLRMGEPYMGR